MFRPRSSQHDSGPRRTEGEQGGREKPDRGRHIRRTGREERDGGHAEGGGQRHERREEPEQRRRGEARQEGDRLLRGARSGG